MVDECVYATNKLVIVLCLPLLHLLPSSHATCEFMIRVSVDDSQSTLSVNPHSEFHTNVTV